MGLQEVIDLTDYMVFHVCMIISTLIAGFWGITGLLCKRNVIAILAAIAIVPAAYYGVFLWSMASATSMAIVDVIATAWLKGKAICLLVTALAIVLATIYRLWKR